MSVIPRISWSTARRVLVRVGCWILAGLVVGALWALLVPIVEDRAQSYERALASDVTLAVLTTLAGAGVAVYDLWRHGGPGATTRFAWSVLGSAAATLVAWYVGGLLGAPDLVSVAVLLFWPLAIALVTVLGTMIATLISRDTY